MLKLLIILMLTGALLESLSSSEPPLLIDSTPAPALDAQY